MSSPPVLDFPSSDQDVEMNDESLSAGPGTTSNSVPGAPPRDPLFLAETPLRGVTARRALGMSTPKAQRTPLFAPSSSPISFPSSPAQAQRKGTGPSSDRPQDSDPLDFPSSSTRTPLNLRGDIHSSVSLTPLRRRPTTTATPNPNNSDQPLPLPPSSQPHPNLSANAPHPSSEPDEIRAIWGTTVNLTETMSLFRDFLRGFKPKYRAAYDRSTPTTTSTRRSTKPFTSPEEAEKLTYESYLRTMRQTSETNLNLDIVNLLAYPPAKKLHTQLLKYPQEVIPAMDQVLKDCMIDIAEVDQAAGMEDMVGKQGEEEIAEILGRVYKVRPFGVEACNMRGLNPSDTDKLISLRGLLLRTSPLLPDLQTAFFRCQTCNHTLLVPTSRGKITEPPVCPRDICSSPSSLILIHNRSQFADRQIWKIQETPDEVPAGQTPHSVEICVYDELVDLAKPGDRVCVTGIFRSVGVRVNPRQRTLKSLFRTFVDAVHVGVVFGASSGGEGIGLDKSTRPTSGDRAPGIGDPFSVYDDGDDASTTTSNRVVQTKAQALVEKLRTLSRNPNIYSLLARSLAPSIYALEDVKKGILLQLFGGTNKNVAKGGGAGGAGGPRFRGDINVLMVGDPGVSKSQILQYVHKIAPRGVYASGKGSSAVGLTAYVTRDADTKQLVLESGALVLSDGGVCCIDEFDKMSDATRSVLHEVMEQQTVSIAKAGIITTLNARTSILAAANPINSKYDPDLPITRNIDLPPTLISRFDLLYLVLDTVDEDLDRKLAKHIVGLYIDDDGAAGRGERRGQRREEAEEEQHLPLADLSAYITYARTHIKPIISQEASEALVSAYLDMRHPDSNTNANAASNSEKQITATTRQLESLIRLSEAHSRMRFSDFVQVADVHEASRLMREAIKTSAMDPRTGKIDMGLINSGTGSGQRRMREDMRKELMSLLDDDGGKGGKKMRRGGGGGMKWTEVVKMLSEQSSVKVDLVEFAEVVKGLENEGVLKVVGEREKRVIRRID